MYLNLISRLSLRCVQVLISDVMKPLKTNKKDIGTLKWQVHIFHCFEFNGLNCNFCLVLQGIIRTRWTQPIKKNTSCHVNYESFHLSIFCRKWENSKLDVGNKLTCVQAGRIGIVGVHTKNQHILISSYCTLFSSEETELGWAETSPLSQINTYCFQASGPRTSGPSQVFPHWNFVYMF